LLVQSSMKNINKIIDLYYVNSSPIRTWIFVALGSICAAFAILGIWIPGWPTVSWAIPSAFFYSLSSKKLFVWTLTNPYFGDFVYQYYEQGKTITIRTKILIVLLIVPMVLSSAYLVYKVSYPVDPGYGPAIILTSGLCGLWYVLYVVKTRPKDIDVQNKTTKE
jgi:uncharacterized protein